MYMAPVTKARSPSSPVARRVVGVPVLIVSTVVMVPWLAVNAVVSAVVLGGRAIGQAPRALLQAVEYAGEIGLGR